MEMKRYQFYVGTLDKDKLEKIKPDREFITIFDFLFDNYTIQLGQGRYTMQETQTTITEKTFIITVIDSFDDATIKYITSNLKRLLNQECIMVTEEHLARIEFM